MEKKSKQSVFHTPWTEKSNNNNNKKSNQPYMLKCGHVKKRRRVYALEKNGHWIQSKIWVNNARIQ